MDILTNIIESDSNHCLATWHETLIPIWWGPARAQDVVRMGDAALALLRARRGPAHLLLVIEPTSPPPVGDVLDAFARFSRDVVSKLGVAVAVAEGGGFRAASIRSVAAALALVLPNRLPYKFVDTVEAGAALLAPHLSPAAGGSLGLLRAVDSLRKHTAGSRRAGG